MGEDELYFADKLSYQPKDAAHLQAEYYHYEQKYNLSQFSMEEHLPICVVVAQQPTKQNKHKLYESIRGQNYTNYHVVHLFRKEERKTHNIIDADYFQDENFMERVQMTSFSPNEHSFEDIVKKNCKKKDIAVEITSDGYFVGRQAFNAINGLYRKEDALMANFGVFHQDEACGCPKSSSGRLHGKLLTYRLQFWDSLQQIWAAHPSQIGSILGLKNEMVEGEVGQESGLSGFIFSSQQYIFEQEKAGAEIIDIGG